MHSVYGNYTRTLEQFQLAALAKGSKTKSPWTEVYLRARKNKDFTWRNLQAIDLGGASARLVTR